MSKLVFDEWDQPNSIGSEVKATEVKIIDPITGASKGQKIDRYDLIPPEFEDALATHYGQGAKKYADRNWEKGMKWGRCFGSMMRHAWAFWRGEDFDPETGTHHMMCAAWNAIAIYTYATRKVGEDDRYRNVSGI